MPSRLQNLDPGLAIVLREVLDPELGLNVVDLGLIYVAKRTEDAIEVKLTLTSPGCPMKEVVLAQVQERIAAVYLEVARVDVELVWTPRWCPEIITDRGYKLMGREREGRSSDVRQSPAGAISCRSSHIVAARVAGGLAGTAAVRSVSGTVSLAALLGFATLWTLDQQAVGLQAGPNVTRALDNSDIE
jgi:metal-sulfur cluster biosynthetic enzyme